jgi:hypothetical protein
MVTLNLSEGKLTYDVFYQTKSGLKVHREDLPVTHPQHLKNYLKKAGVNLKEWGFESRIKRFVSSKGTLKTIELL